jgi:hypothetical protein
MCASIRRLHGRLRWPAPGRGSPALPSGSPSIVATVGARADGVRRASWRFEARASRAAGDGATSKGRQAEPLTDRSPLRLRCA